MKPHGPIFFAHDDPIDIDGNPFREKNGAVDPALLDDFFVIDKSTHSLFLFIVPKNFDMGTPFALGDPWNICTGSSLSQTYYQKTIYLKKVL